MMKKLTLLCLAALMAFSVTGCMAEEPAQDSEPMEEQSTTVQSVAADLQLKTLDGTTVSLKDLYQDKPVYLNFWASWCPPCVKEMPHIQSLQDKYGDKINVVAVTVDENSADAAAFVKKAGLTMPIYTGDLKAMASAYGLSAIPVSIIIDKDGNILDQTVGGMDEAGLEAFIAPILK